MVEDEASGPLRSSADSDRLEQQQRKDEEAALALHGREASLRRQLEGDEAAAWVDTRALADAAGEAATEQWRTRRAALRSAILDDEAAGRSSIADTQRASLGAVVSEAADAWRALEAAHRHRLGTAEAESRSDLAAAEAAALDDVERAHREAQRQRLESPAAQWPPPPGADIDMAGGPHEGSEDDVIVPSDPDDGAEHYSPSSSGSGF